MRHLSLLFAVLFVVPLLGSDSPKEYDDRAEEAGIEGDWLLVQTEEDGNGFAVLPDHVYSYRASTFHWSSGAWGTYSVDHRFRPTRLTERSTMGYTQRSIFQIDGKTLRVAYLKSGDDYPDGFRDARGLHVEVYRRVP